MRGDSLRDFYAKTLAVAGLGLLAGAGAIVDYWPVGGKIPTVTRVAGLDQRVPVSLPNAPDPASVPAPVIRAAAPRTPAVVIASGPVPIATVEIVLPPAPLMIALTNDLPYGPAIVLPEMDTFTDPASELIGMEELGQHPVLATGGETDDSHGILADAFRRTRESLRGARGFFGGQIDKIQGMMGAVKRASPFWDVSGAQPR